MLFLSGLLGMMALGSVAIVGTGTFEGGGLSDDGLSDDGLADVLSDGGAEGGADVCGPAAQEAQPEPASPAAEASQRPSPDDGVNDQGHDQGRSLFARMGLINLTFAGDSGDADGPDAPEDSGATSAGQGPDAEILSLDAFRVAPATQTDPEQTDPAPDVLTFDSEEDSLVIVYDDSAGGGDPTLELRANGDAPGMTDIVVDGSVLGRLPAEEAPPLESILLVGESTAAALSLG